MTIDNGRYSELSELLEALCEDRISPAQATRLEELVLADCEARQFYLQYIELHGTLYWDTAKGGGEELAAHPVTRDAADRSPVKSRLGDGRTPSPPTVERPRTAAGMPAAPRRRRLRNRWSTAAAALMAAAILVGLGLFVQQRFFPNEQPGGLAGNPGTPGRGDAGGIVSRDGADAAPGSDLGRQPDDSDGGGGPIALPRRNVDGSEGRFIALSEPPVGAPDPPFVAVGGNDPPVRTRPLPATPVEFIDEQVAAGWTLAGVEPSDRADDGEWIRRVYLDVVGRIPPVDVVERFLKDPRPDKRSLLIDQLLDDPAYVANWSTIWTNLLIGRANTSGDVNRTALRSFLRRSFGENRPWNENVYELVSAEGDNEENGAANFLLAHLNNDAVPATAVTARLFLGTQVQCTQCHHHPFNEWKQNQFWELNSCFQQTAVVHEQKINPLTGKRKRVARLVNRPLGGPIFYEDRQSLMLTALPKFAGVSIDPDADTNRRRELARLMTAGEEPLIAPAMVNRTWEHFFGYGFTRPVDDMGPHNPATHPALLDRLARDFIASGFDLKQLIRWIANSRPYQLSSRLGETNAADDPAAGEPPLFSRMYVKSMTVEQLYDSLLIATQADESGGVRWEDVERRRQQWLQQFVVAFQTEENDETTTFDGTLPQALMMMNGQLVQEAVSSEPGTYLHRVLSERSSETEKIRKLFLATLSRYPTPEELALYRKLLLEQAANRGGNRSDAIAEGLRDLFWAFLNSSEFITVH